MCTRKTLPYKPWIDEECQKLIQERRIVKKTAFLGARYHELCKKVSKACRRAKRAWLEKHAEEAEHAHNTNATREVFRLVKVIAGKRTTKSGIGIKDEHGRTIYDKDKILKRWSEYGTLLFDGPDPEPVGRPCAMEPLVLRDEVRKAVKRLKSNKAAGLDNIPAELLKAGGETVIDALKSIIDSLWVTGEWPEEWVMSELIALPKEAGTQECTKHRTISLISHASKVALNIIRQRIQQYLFSEIADEQFGFVPGKGTVEAMICLRNLIEKSVKRQERSLWLMFVDYAKAFDTIDHNMVWTTLREFGVPQHLIWLIRKLYEKAAGKIRIDEEHTVQFRFKKGVRQGCILSPLLFITCGESIMRSVAESIAERSGCIIAGTAIWNVRYADDTTLVATSAAELQRQVDELQRHSLPFGLKINPNKCFIMVINGDDKSQIEVDGKVITRVDQVKYLGSMITTDSSSTKDICARLAIARRATLDLTRVWKAKGISLDLKKRLVKALVWSIASYGCESWSLKKSDEGKLTAFEMWVWRRMLRISWTERRTNQAVRDQIQVPEEAGLLQQIRRRKIAKYGHWKRRPESIVTATIEGEVEGRGRHGRRRAAWIDDIKRWTEGGLTEARRKAVQRL